MPSNTRRIKPADDAALVQILLDYIKGHSIDEITLRLKEQCNKFDIACKDRYQAIAPNEANAQYRHWLDAILDALSVGGAPVHLVSVNEAKDEGKFNCYVWHNDQLFYLQRGCEETEVILSNQEPLKKTLDALNTHSQSQTRYLCAKQIHDLITTQSESQQYTHTTDLNLINRCRSSHDIYYVLKKLKLKHPRLSLLLDKIDEATPSSKWWPYVFFATGLTAIAGVAYYLIENFSLVRAWYERALPVLTHWLNNTVNLLRKTPLIGVLSNAIPLINSWYQAVIDDSITDTNKLIKLSFKTIEHTLPSIAYVLCYLAAGAMTIPAVTLLITAAVIDVIESLYTLIYHQCEHYFNPLPPATEYYSAAAKTCADSGRERNLFLSLVIITANLLTTASVIIWCIYPPSFIIAIACVVGSTLVGLTKNYLVGHIKNNYANALQSDLKEIFEQYHVSNRTEKDIEKILLHQEIEELKQTNALLRQERDAIKDMHTEDRTEWMRFFNANRPNTAANAERLDDADLTIQPDEETSAALSR